MGPGTRAVGATTVGVSPAGPGPQTVSAAPQPGLGQRAWFRGRGRGGRVPRLPWGARRGGSSPRRHPDAATGRSQVLSPPPSGPGRAARPGVAGSPPRGVRPGDDAPGEGRGGLFRRLGPPVAQQPPGMLRGRESPGRPPTPTSRRPTSAPRRGMGGTAKGHGAPPRRSTPRGWAWGRVIPWGFVLPLRRVGHQVTCDWSWPGE